MSQVERRYVVRFISQNHKLAGRWGVYEEFVSTSGFPKLGDLMSVHEYVSDAHKTAEHLNEELDK